MSKRDGITEGYFLLSVAIVKQAAKDYRVEYHKFLKTGYKTARLREVERWLRSNYGSFLSFGKGELIMQLVRKDVNSVIDDEEDEEDYNDGTDWQPQEV